MDAYLGEIRLFSGTFVPEGWHPCDGSPLKIADHDALYSLIGTLYGGDGVADFAVPNLDARIPIGFGATYPMARTGGAVEVTLKPAEIPIHTHPMRVSKNSATKATPDANAATSLLAAPTAIGDSFYLKPAATPTAEPTLAAGSINEVGGGKPHANLMPTFALQYIIATKGEYPHFED